MHASFNRDLDLGTDTVGCCHQNRVLEARSLKVEQAAKTADFGVRACPRGGPDHRLDQVDQPVSGVDVDARG